MASVTACTRWYEGLVLPPSMRLIVERDTPVSAASRACPLEGITAGMNHQGLHAVVQREPVRLLQARRVRSDDHWVLASLTFGFSAPGFLRVNFLTLDFVTSRLLLALLIFGFLVLGFLTAVLCATSVSFLCLNGLLINNGLTSLQRERKPIIPNKKRKYNCDCTAATRQSSRELFAC